MEITLAETKHTNPIRKLRRKKKKKTPNTTTHGSEPTNPIIKK